MFWGRIVGVTKYQMQNVTRDAAGQLRLID
jgi:hypothetical protein